MFEGENIHLSPIDGKRLCSFSRKICKQRRLNGFAFCIRHILEDRNSPFKQCNFRRKPHGERCFNAVPIHADRIYCNSHLQVLGLLPKTISKKGTLEKRENEKSRKNKLSNTKMKKVTPAVLRNITGVNIKTFVRKTHLDKAITAVQNTTTTKWNNVSVKNLQSSLNNVHRWRVQQLTEEVEEFKNSWTHNGEQPSDYHVITDVAGIMDSHLESFQTTFLSTSERVYHNTLRTDSVTYQERKVLSKLRHQCGQLELVLKAKRNSGNLSYSVLSKLVASARANAMETANVLSVGASDVRRPCKIFRTQAATSTYKVPCCLITDNIRCTNTALPFMKHCRDHVTEDMDQILFLKSLQEPSRRSHAPMSLNFMKIYEQQLRKGDGILTSRQRKLKLSADVRKPNSRKNSKLKKTNLPKSLKAQMQRKFAVPTNPSMKMNAHLKKSPIKLKTIEKEQERVNVVNDASPTTSSDESESSASDEDAECDILTPEEAFHLPPGSLSSFPSHIDDDDSLSAIQRSRDLDDDDDDFIRCSNSFAFELNSQISRDLSSPTLNQLSSSDFDSAFNMLLSPVKTTSMSSDACAMTASLVPTFCSSDTISTNTKSNLSFLPTRNSNIKPHGTTVTSLKISPVTASARTINFSSGFLPKQEKSMFPPLNTNFCTLDRQQSFKQTNAFTANGHLRFVSNNQSVNKFGAFYQIPQTKESNTNEQNAWNKRYFNDSLLIQQPFHQDTALFNDIRTDMDASPLEKVNPDIFFSSVFPVATTTTKT